MILESWGAIEADFARYYFSLDPLKTTWRRFLVLLRHLPGDGAFGNALQEEREYKSGNWWKRALDKVAGRESPTKTSSMTLNDLMKQGGL